jgi:hypothetical protein
VEPGIPEGPGGAWALGPLVLGHGEQAADVLTRAHGPEELRTLVGGPADFVELFAAVAGRK